MYRKREKASRKMNEKMARWRKAKEQKRMDRPAPEYPPDLPRIRRRIIVEDYDGGETTSYEFELQKSSRRDCYLVFVDGVKLPGRHGWSKTLEIVRKSFLRVR